MSTLAPRGAELANGADMRGMFSHILDDPYDAQSNPGGFVNIGTAENYAMLPEVADFLSRKPIALTAADFSYGEGPWSSKRLRGNMASFLNRALKPVVEIEGNDVLIANGVTSVCELAAFSIGDPGDGVLMGRPLYQAFVPDFGTKAKITAVHVPFGDEDQFAPAAAACYEKALQEAEAQGTKVRALLLCNPHNPLGQCYPRETIVALMKLCQKYKIHLLSDEIYAMSVYDVPDTGAVPFTSVLSFDSGKFIDKDYLHVLYGMSKDFACGGLRLGCLYTRNKELWRAVSAMSQFHWPGVAGERVACQILEDRDWLEGFFERSRSRLAERNKLARSLLDGKDIRYHKGGNAGFFLWFDLSPYLSQTGKEGWEAEEALGKKMIEAMVFATPGKALNSEKPGWFRVIFSQDEDVIKEGMRRLFNAVGA